jgi:hypothetical protein
MEKIILACRGDNNWREVFDSEEGAYWFLYGLLSKVERYYKNSDFGSFAFDIEDDCILWKQGDKIKYCNGWHWIQHNDKEKIVMPDGRELYSIFSELEN